MGCMQKRLHHFAHTLQGCTSLVTSPLVSLAHGQKSFESPLGVLLGASAEIWQKTLCPSGSGDGLEIHWALPARVRIPSVSMHVHSASAHGPKTVSGLEALGHQPPAHAHKFSCPAGVVWARGPGFFSGLEPFFFHAPQVSNFSLPSASGPLSMPQKLVSFPCPIIISPLGRMDKASDF